MEFTNVHFGKLIKQKLDDQRKTVHWLAQKIEVSDRTIRNMFLEAEIPIERLKKISLALNEDLFVLLLSTQNHDLLKGILIPPPTKMEAVINALSEKVGVMEKEIGELKEKVGR